MVRIKNPQDYKLVRYEIAHDKHKYFAILQNKKTGRERRVGFGAKGFQHYHDKLGHYARLDHWDKARRRRYLLRHAGNKDFIFSSGWFSAKLLWST